MQTEMTSANRRTGIEITSAKEPVNAGGPDPPPTSISGSGPPVTRPIAWDSSPSLDLFEDHPLCFCQEGQGMMASATAAAFGKTVSCLSFCHWNTSGNARMSCPAFLSSGGANLTP